MNVAYSQTNTLPPNGNHISDNYDVDDLGVSYNNEIENTVKLFPNPTTGNFTLETNGNNQLQSLIIYNVSGQLIDKISIENVSRYNYTKRLEQGTYLLVIQTNDDMVIYKKMVVL
jgi:hypothetical protein